MKARGEHIAHAAENLARYYAREVSLGERASHNFEELSAYVALAAAKEFRSRGFFADGSLGAYLPVMPDPLEYLSDVLPENLPLLQAKLGGQKRMAGRLDGGSAWNGHLREFC